MIYGEAGKTVANKNTAFRSRCQKVTGRLGKRVVGVGSVGLGWKLLYVAPAPKGASYAVE